MSLQSLSAKLLTLSVMIGAIGYSHALEIFPVIKNPATDFDPADGMNSPVIGRPFSFADPGASYGIDNNGILNGNNVLVVTQLPGLVTGNGGAGFTLTSLSNGENGITQTRNNGGDIEIDADNVEPVSPAIETVNGVGQKLQNGNVLRFSMWMRLDPSSPLTFAPQIEPLIKLEAWKEYGSLTQDTNPGLLAPGFGDKIFDQQQHGIPIAQIIPYPAESAVQWVDLDSDGLIGRDDLADDEGRITTLTTDAWTLVEVNYEIDDSFWLGIHDNNSVTGPDTSVVAALEEIRATMFLGDFTSGLETPNTLEAGNILVDNISVELFPDQAAADSTPNNNPDPTLDEVAAVPGDYNNNGTVDAADYTLWRDNLGQMVALDNEGDGITPGEVTQEDYDFWAANFGNSNAPTTSIAPSQAVPEPGSASLILFGCLVAGCCRKNC